jgi:hypothetical protein
MSRAIVLTAAAAVLVSTLAKAGRRNRSGVTPRKDKDYGGRDSFEVSAHNLKAAVKKVDKSAAKVDVALKALMAAA